VGLGNPEAGLNLLQREAQQRAVVLIEESRGGGDEKDATLTLSTLWHKYGNV
jgi:hypothetical protein